MEIEKIVYIEKIVEVDAGELEKHVTRAFELGTQLATKAKEQLAEEMVHEMQEIKQVAEEMMQKMQKAVEDKRQKDAELKDSKDREHRMKEMLAKALAQLKEGHALENVVEGHKIVEKIVEVRVEKLVGLKKIVMVPREQRRSSSLMYPGHCRLRDDCFGCFNDKRSLLQSGLRHG